MKPRAFNAGRRVLADAVSPRSVQYFLILAVNRAQFVRVEGGRFGLLASATVETSDNDELDRFVTTLADSKLYYGQPVTVLLNNNCVYTFIKSVDEDKPQTVLEDLRSLRADDVELVHYVEKRKNRRIMVAQGIDKNHLNALKKLMADGGLLVSDVFTLGAYVFKRVLPSSLEAAGVDLFDFGSFCCGLITDSLGHFIYISHIERHGRSCDAIVEELRSKYFETGPAVRRTIYEGPTPNGDGGNGRLPGLFWHRPGTRSRVPSPLTPPRWGRGARWLSVALNSGKLLAWILSVVAVLSFLGAVITDLLSSGDESTIAAYQDKYTTKLSLERQLDSLSSLEKTLVQNSTVSFRAASVVSSFCQVRYLGLYLNRITLRRAGRDSIIVDVDGSSGRGTRVFQYRQALDSLMQPYALSISSIKPNIMNLRGQVDTVFDFKLSAVLDGR